ncbi:hypothetical protein Syun_015054 [Stephania yunnanensis]|uniref:Uncharacterized protein n=1 Tax=Stephania yunnanensis TaxID=152371 RepID=A0AAP0JMM1_9MAGN
MTMTFSSDLFVFTLYIIEDNKVDLKHIGKSPKDQQEVYYHQNKYHVSYIVTHQSSLPSTLQRRHLKLLESATNICLINF